MIYKKNYLKTILLLFMVIYLVFPADNVLANGKNILIVYDSYKEYGEDYNSLNEVVKAALSLNSNLKLSNINSIQDDISEYDGIIILKNTEEVIKESVKEKFNTYNGTVLFINNTSLDNDIKNKININIENNLDLSGFSNEEKNNKIMDKIKETFDSNNSKSSIYLVLDEVYPFDDLNDIVDKVDYLYDKGVPFILSTMPVFNNTNSEAMKRYSEVLRYAQSKGGVIIMHSPDIYQSDDIQANIDEVLKKIEFSYESYINYWVYPRAIDIPEKWLYYNNIEEYLNISNTVFLDSSKAVGKIELDNVVIKNVENVIQKIPIDKFDYERNYPNNIAVTLNNNIKIDDFKKYIHLLNKREIYFNNPIYLDTYLNIGKNEINASNGSVILNEKDVTPQKFISIKEFENMFKNNAQYENTQKFIDLTKVNKGIILVTLITVFIFIIIGLRSRSIDRNKFFK